MNDPPTARVLPEQHLVDVSFTVGEADELLADLPLGHSVSQTTRNLYVKLRDALRQPFQGGSLPQIPDTGDADIRFAPPQPVRPAPTRQPRRGYVIRKVDVTGISGLGHIAEICVFSDNFTVIRWLGGPPQNQPKHEVYDNKGPDPFIQISGHNGNTEIVWLDEEESDEL
jgi:hypothetical protein